MIDPIRLQALHLAESLPNSANAIQKVSQETDPESARWAFLQRDLRERAKTKFSRASEMLFVREALEQATGEPLANYHAGFFPPGELVVDMTAGIGGDLLALARRGPVMGFERDPERAEIANHNLTVFGFEPTVRTEDSTIWLKNACQSGENPNVLLDPARRIDGERVQELTKYEPDPMALMPYLVKCRTVVLKLSPIMNEATLVQMGMHITFVSQGGECKEALVVISQAHPPGVECVHLASGEKLVPLAFDQNLDTPNEYFYEADPAAIRGKALGTLCEKFGLACLGNSNGYLTGPNLVFSPWLKTFRVLYHGSAHERNTRIALQGLNAATPELKQRGVKEKLDRLKKAYAGLGTKNVALAFWTIGYSVKHTILEPLQPT